MEYIWELNRKYDRMDGGKRFLVFFIPFIILFWGGQAFGYWWFGGEGIMWGYVGLFLCCPFAALRIMFFIKVNLDRKKER